jgi:phosphoglucomutase
VIAVSCGRENGEDPLGWKVLANELDWGLEISICGDDHGGVEEV